MEITLSFPVTKLIKTNSTEKYKEESNSHS